MGKEINRDYSPGINSGRLVGRTVQIDIDGSGNITYPPGHILFTSDLTLSDKWIEGTINYGENTYDPTGQVHTDNHPRFGQEAVYAYDVNGKALRNSGH